MFKENHLYPKSGNAGDGISLSLRFLLVSGLGTCRGIGEGGRFFCACFWDIQRAALKSGFDFTEPSKRLLVIKMQKRSGLLLFLSILYTAFY